MLPSTYVQVPEYVDIDTNEEADTVMARQSEKYS